MVKRRGIRTKVTLSVALLVITSLTLLGIVLSIQLFTSEKNKLLALQDEVLNYAINEIEWDAHQIETLFDITTIYYDILSLSSKEQFDALSQILTHQDTKQQKVLDEFTLLDSKGVERAKVSRTIVYTPSELVDMSETDEFRIPASTGQMYYGPMSFDELTHEPRMKLSIPIIDIQSGQVNGVLVGKIRLHRIWGNVVERSFANSGIVFITDPGGKVIAHPDSSVVYRNTVFKAKAASGIQAGIDGTKAMLTARNYKLGEQTFTVIASLPFSEVIDLSLNALSTTTIFTLLFLVCSIIVSYIMVQRIVRPIETLAEKARDISTGKIGHTVKVGNSDEIEDLSSAFNIMTTKLFENIDSLKNQMAELQQAEEKIKKQNEFLNVILNSLTHPFYVIDANNYNVKIANEAAGFGVLSGTSTCYALSHNSDTPCEETEHPCVIKKIKETGKPVTLEHIHYDNKGNTFISEVHGYPIFDSEGNISEVIEYNLDISERKKMQAALLLSEEKNRSITSTASDAMIMMDEEGRISFWNPAAERIFGYLSDEVMNKEMHALIAPERYIERYLAGIKNFSISGQGASIGKDIVLTAKRKNGEEFPIELSLTSILVNSKWHAIGIVRDITKRKESENQIIASLKEKEILLREIHHRTKNNMQVISSLLNLQSEFIKDKKYADMLNESRNRIAAMALVHEKLYLSQNLANINFRDYVDSLTSGLFAFYGISRGRIKLRLDVEEIPVEIEVGIPCGLIINELVSNAMKHAFPDDRRGEICITFKVIDEEGGIKYQMTVADNGIGLPEGFEVKKAKSLGLHLVTSLAEHQLQGKLLINRDKGTEFCIEFKEIQYKKRF